MFSPTFYRCPLAWLCAVALWLACVSPLLAVAPVFFPVQDQSGRVNVSFTYQVAADFSPTSYSAAGLPNGVAIDAASGLISGTPTEAGTFRATLSAANADGTGTAELNVVIVPPLPVVTLTPEVASGYPAQGIDASFLLTRSGDPAEDLFVSVVLTGSAKNGQDYQAIKLSRKIKAGKATKRVRIRAVDQSGQGIAKKIVKMTLQDGEEYNLGDAITAKVKIYYTP